MAACRANAAYASVRASRTNAPRVDFGMAVSVEIKTGKDLFSCPSIRRRGVARALIESVQREALAAGVRRLYWQTHYGNNVARGLYDKVAQHHGFIVYALDALP
ncbi:GNAT family N-acetyltransferase [Verminephrobacter eiseniae]|nr:GNAT family N-acetyltransferase [Verminephrobacter eiseniae]MCW5293346.1 GNAT family N-acetyltransferase [Verminephrobacter eiseniae]MCW8186781.1 GNAT family N-acetyltransferase [Verminephrobacter eiseniae]MCW8225144.1 GNAT family N-acetyltransferase [Verminephrobacter eiseniae]MCW8236112.1 GNAT family N-acetyltransferase [Verminephrobacter eiseniae]